jgi:hypothetical protein
MDGHLSPADAAEHDPIEGLRETLLTVRPGADFGLLQRAYHVSAQCHRGQYRKSGDPYITHPVAVATIVAEHMVLDRLRTRPGLRAAEALAAIGSADHRVATLKMADRLHNMRTLQFLRPPRQQRKAREVLDIFAPAAEELRMPTIGTELQTLAFATLIRNRAARLPSRRTIVALDIERSTSRPDPVKAELRIMLYELFDAALRGAGIYPDQRDPFIDRGDGLLALLHPGTQAPAALVLSRAVPYLGRLLATYNAGVGTQRQLRVRVVVHAGEVNDDGRGWFGAALDTACRLLDAPAAKQALAAAPGPLLVVVSGDVCRSGGMDLGPGPHRISVDVGGQHRDGWAFVPGR